MYGRRETGCANGEQIADAQLQVTKKGKTKLVFQQPARARLDGNTCTHGDSTCAERLVVKFACGPGRDDDARQRRRLWRDTKRRSDGAFCPMFELGRRRIPRVRRVADAHNAGGGVGVLKYLSTCSSHMTRKMMFEMEGQNTNEIHSPLPRALSALKVPQFGPKSYFFRFYAPQNLSANNTRIHIIAKGK